MNPLFLSKFVAGLFLGSLAFADHPNEGSLDLKALVQESLAQNQELKSQCGNYRQLADFQN